MSSARWSRNKDEIVHERDTVRIKGCCVIVYSGRDFVKGLGDTRARDEGMWTDKHCNSLQRLAAFS